MSLLTYQETRPFAKAIRASVLAKKMPPWFADPSTGKFSNDHSLAARDIDTLVAWADSGAREGDPEDAPAPVQFTEGWNIGTPDLVVQMPQPYQVPASGTVDYTYYIVPMNLKEDIWVEAAEVRPGDRSLVHHVIAFVRPPGMNWLRNAKPGEAYVPPVTKDEKGKERREGSMVSQWLVGYAPGVRPETTRPGLARLIPAGSDLILQMHFTPNGKSGLDQTRVGLRLAKQKPAERMLMLASGNSSFEIPPGAPNYEVKSSVTLKEDVKLVSLGPHMHVRGKAFEMRAVYPTGETEVLLKVPRYDFNWQTRYLLAEEKLLPKGTKIDCTAWYDNSPNNRHNPNPNATVRHGDQSWDEMMIGFFDVAAPPRMELKDVLGSAARPQRPVAER